MAWGYDVDAHVVAGLINPHGRAQSRAAPRSTRRGDGEARFYSRPDATASARRRPRSRSTTSSDVDPNDRTDIKDTRFTADLQVAIGGGYGRVLDVGARDPRPPARAHARRRARARQADRRRDRAEAPARRGGRCAASARRYRALTSRPSRSCARPASCSASPTRGSPTRSSTCCATASCSLRPSGFDVQVAIGEGYLAPARRDGRSGRERARPRRAAARARRATAAQLQDDKLEVSGTAYARYRLFAPDDRAVAVGRRRDGADATVHVRRARRSVRRARPVGRRVCCRRTAA